MLNKNEATAFKNDNQNKTKNDLPNSFVDEWNRIGSISSLMMSMIFVIVFVSYLVVCCIETKLERKKKHNLKIIKNIEKNNQNNRM